MQPSEVDGLKVIQIDCGARPSRRPSSNAIVRRESSVEESAERDDWMLTRISASARGGHSPSALWGTRVSTRARSRTSTRRSTAKIEALARSISADPKVRHPYLYLDGHRDRSATWAGEVRNVSLLVASAVNSEMYIGRFSSASARAPRRTHPAGRRFCVEPGRPRPQRACSLMRFPMPVEPA